MPDEPDSEFSILGTLQSLDAAAPPPNLTEEEVMRRKLDSKSPEDKMYSAWEYKMRGMSNVGISKIFGVTPQTIIRWIKNAKEEFRKSFECESAADNLSGQILVLESIEQMALYEVALLSNDEKTVDPKTGKVSTSSETHQRKANKAKFLKLALDTRRSQIDLLVETGVIPRDPGRMYKTLEDEGRLAEDKLTQQTAAAGPVDRKRLIGDLLEKMERTVAI